MQVFKYILEGLAVTLSASLIFKRSLVWSELTKLGLVAALTFMIIDMFAPRMSGHSRHGAGFGIGIKQVGGECCGSKDIGDYQDHVGGSSHPSHEGAGGKYVETQYSEAALAADYNEWVLPYNTEGINSLKEIPLELLSETSSQRGGAEVAVAQAPSMPQTILNHVSSVIPNIPIPIPPHVEPQPVIQQVPSIALRTTQRRKDSYAHDPRYLYSGDIISMRYARGKIAGSLQRGQGDNKVIISTAPDNLSKLRFHSVEKGNTMKQIRVHYGDILTLKHNAYVDNKNKSLFVKLLNPVQSHQASKDSYSTCMLLNAVNPKLRGPVKLSDPVLISNTSGNETRYVVVQDNATLRNNGTAAEASQFSLRVLRAHEIGGRNLCVCPTEQLFP